MKKKLLLSIILFVGLFVSVFSFINPSSAVTLDDMGLTQEQQKDLLIAYDLNKDGKITSRDVSLIKQSIYIKKENRFTEAECTLVHRLVVKDLRFKWYRNNTVTKLRYFDQWISMGKLLYIDYFPNGSGKIIAHINIHGRIFYVSYDYDRYGGRW